MVANGDGSISGAQSQTGSTGDGGGNGILLNNNARWQGAMMATKALQFANNSTSTGRRRQHGRRRQQRDPGRLPDDHHVPAGMPGNETVYAQTQQPRLSPAKDGAPRRRYFSGERRRGRLRVRPALALGSFLNVVAARVPLRRSIVRPASACMACERADRVVRQRAARLVGRSCGAAAGAAVRGSRSLYPAVELATALLVAGCVARLRAHLARRSSRRSSARCSS